MRENKEDLCKEHQIRQHGWLKQKLLQPLMCRTQGIQRRAPKTIRFKEREG